ncbi:MAG: Fe-S cluster assembly protein SufD [Alphaproteobacteria bacterium]
MSGTTDLNATIEAAEAGRARAYAAHRAALPGAGTPWLDALRDAAMDAFAATGLPNRRMESWKYIDLRAIAETEWQLAAPAGAVDLSAPLCADAVRLVTVDGRYRPDLSDRPEPGVAVTGMAEVLARGDASAERAFGPAAWGRSGPMIALNTALAADGLVIAVAEDAQIARPVEILHWSTAAPAPTEYHARHAMLLDAGARLTVVERFAGAAGAPVLANHGCAVALARGAILDHVRLQDEAAATLHIAANDVRLAHGAAYRGSCFGLGAAAARVDLDVVLAEERASFDLAAAYLARGSQQADLTTRVRHAAPHGSSAQLVKGVVDGRARGIFQGAIAVEPHAQRTEARQYGRALLLSREAEVDTKPELRIEADDVQCAHGAAIGALDADQLFYLRARGIDATTARAMLVEAFVGEVVARVPVEPVRAALASLAHAWLAGERAA